MKTEAENNGNYKVFFGGQRSISYSEGNFINGQVQPDSQPCLPLSPHKCRLAQQVLRCRSRGDRAPTSPSGTLPCQEAAVLPHTVSSPRSTSLPQTPQVPHTWGSILWPSRTRDLPDTFRSLGLPWSHLWPARWDPSLPLLLDCPPPHPHPIRVIPPGSWPTCNTQLSLTVVDAAICHRDYPSHPTLLFILFRTEAFVLPATGLLASVSFQPSPCQETTYSWRKTSSPRSCPSQGTHVQLVIYRTVI